MESAALIQVFKVAFNLALLNKFPGKKLKNMEWQRENIAISGIMRSFELIK
jgi:hypothetical protein